MKILKSTAACAAAITFALMTAPASAAVITTHLNEDISSTPYTIDFGSAGSVTFSTVDPTLFSYNPDGVETSGSVQVFSVGAPFYSANTPTSFYPGRGDPNALFPIGDLGFFASYGTPTAIPYSITEGLIGLQIDQSDGEHYALVDLNGSQITGYEYATVAGEGLPKISISAAVPEPGVWMLMIAGVAGIGMALRKNRRATSCTVAV